MASSRPRADVAIASPPRGQDQHFRVALRADHLRRSHDVRAGRTGLHVSCCATLHSAMLTSIRNDHVKVEATTAPADGRWLRGAGARRQWTGPGLQFAQLAVHPSRLHPLQRHQAPQQRSDLVDADDALVEDLGEELGRLRRGWRRLARSSGRDGRGRGDEDDMLDFDEPLIGSLDGRLTLGGLCGRMSLDEQIAGWGGRAHGEELVDVNVDLPDRVEVAFLAQGRLPPVRTRSTMTA